MIYVFARWLPSEEIRGRSTIYYIPCDSRETAEKLASAVQRFGTDKGNVVEVPSIGELKKHVSNHYRFIDFELTRFPISTDRLLEGAK